MAMRGWWGGRDREITNVSGDTEVKIPWLIFFSSWLLGCLFILGCYLFYWFSSLRSWLRHGATGIDWLMDNWLPYIRVEWPGIILWFLIMFIPAALIFYVRLTKENLLKSWLPYDVASWFRKDKR